MSVPRRYDPDEDRGQLIAKLRRAALEEMDPSKSRALTLAADDLAQNKFPLKIIPKGRQLNLFSGELEIPRMGRRRRQMIAKGRKAR